MLNDFLCVIERFCLYLKVCIHRYSIVMLFRIVICMLLSGLFLSCKGDKAEHGNRTPLAEYNGNWLYLDELSNDLSAVMSEEDSVLVIENAIKEWIGDIQIEELAVRNIRSMDRINELVNKYRIQLLLHDYKEQLAEGRIAEEVTDNAITAYYEANKDQMLAIEPLVLGITLRVPAGAERMHLVREWMRKCDADAIEKIEKYSIQNAIVYNYYRNNWLTMNEALEGTQINQSSLVKSLPDKKVYEFSDSTSITFITIDDYSPAGGPMPIEYAKSQITELFINERISEYLSTYRKEMFDKALGSNKINFVNSLSLRVKENLVDSVKKNTKNNK